MFHEIRSASPLITLAALPLGILMYIWGYELANNIAARVITHCHHVTCQSNKMNFSTGLQSVQFSPSPPWMGFVSGDGGSSKPNTLWLEVPEC